MEGNHNCIKLRLSYVHSNQFLILFQEFASVENVHYCSRELGLQEAMYLQKEGDATSTYERIKSLQEETENYK